ncbi:MAG TPA: hypothetical protein ENI23_11285, partial [bacterium]|nr:hypothetical protein [bacterium]
MSLTSALVTALAVSGIAKTLADVAAESAKMVLLNTSGVSMVLGPKRVYQFVIYIEGFNILLLPRIQKVICPNVSVETRSNTYGMWEDVLPTKFKYTSKLQTIFLEAQDGLIESVYNGLIAEMFNYNGTLKEIDLKPPLSGGGFLFGGRTGGYGRTIA